MSQEMYNLRSGTLGPVLGRSGRPNGKDTPLGLVLSGLLTFLLSGNHRALRVSAIAAPIFSFTSKRPGQMKHRVLN